MNQALAVRGAGEGGGLHGTRSRDAAATSARFRKSASRSSSSLLRAQSRETRVTEACELSVCCTTSATFTRPKPRSRSSSAARPRIFVNSFSSRTTDSRKSRISRPLAGGLPHAHSKHRYRLALVPTGSLQLRDNHRLLELRHRAQNLPNQHPRRVLVAGGQLRSGVGRDHLHAQLAKTDSAGSRPREGLAPGGRLSRPAPGARRCCECAEQVGEPFAIVEVLRAAHTFVAILRHQLEARSLGVARDRFALPVHCLSTTRCNGCSFRLPLRAIFGFSRDAVDSAPTGGFAAKSRRPLAVQCSRKNLACLLRYPLGPLA
jgi:hypothetical protein